MKSIYFKRKNSVIRVLNEDTNKKPKKNWDRIIYISILISLVLMLGNYTVTRLFFIKANGHILFQSVNIRLTDDSRIIDYYKEEGAKVEKGDTLFTYFEDIDNRVGTSGFNYSVSTEAENLDWLEKEKYNLKKKIDLNTIDIEQNRTLITKLKEELKGVYNEVMLDISPKSKLENIKQKIFLLEGDIKKFISENEQLESYIKSLKPRYKKTTRSSGSRGKGSKNGLNIFYSPIEGTVTKIFVQPYEVALKSDNILSIHKNRNIFIKAFFEQEDLKYLKEGDLVDVSFPDGTSSEGVIKRFYFATYPLPEEFQKKYEPVERSLSADIYPVNEEELKKWKGFYKMGIEVTKSKYSLFQWN